MNGIKLINTICKTFLKPGHTTFFKNLHRIREVQESILFSLLKKNAQSAFGRNHHFKTITSIDEYRRNIPVTTYKTYEPYVTHIMHGKQKILTGEKVTLLEPTGGSESGSKYIPYTKTLQNEFNRAIHCWLYDLYSSYPALLNGKGYWSISPCEQVADMTSSVPIGFDDDASYLGLIGTMINKTLVMPCNIKRVKHIDNFRYLTALFLLKEPNITIMSVWNPTFLLILLTYIQENISSLIKDIFDGSVTLPASETIDYLTPYITRNKKRAHEIEQIINRDFPHDFSKFWKNLVIISCWGDGPSDLYAQKLHRHFPGITFQYKGLLATEGIISFPLTAAGGNIAAYTSHFLEFFPTTGGGSCLLHELEAGGHYKVVITTGGGLYRYALGDIIEVTGHYQGLPVFKFIGRDKTSDMFGEKLSEGHVKHVLLDAFIKYSVNPDFYLLAPELDHQNGYYVLYIDNKDLLPTSLLNKLEKAIEEGLRTNYHYKYARSLHQLRPIQCRQIKNGMHTYITRRLKQGQKAGDIKPTVLDATPGWDKLFTQGKRI